MIACTTVCDSFPYKVDILFLLSLDVEPRWFRGKAADFQVDGTCSSNRDASSVYSLDMKLLGHKSVKTLADFLRDLKVQRFHSDIK